MRQPAKQSQPQAGASISTSNETCFAFLGGRRPSWMTSGAPRPGDDGGTQADAHPTQHANPLPKNSADGHALPSGIAAQSGAQAVSQGTRAPEKHSRAIASSAVVLPSPALSSEPDSAASTPVPVESTICLNGSAVSEQQTSAPTTGGIFPVPSQADVQPSASSNVATSRAAIQPTYREAATTQDSRTGTAADLHTPEKCVPNDLPTPPRPQTLELAAASSTSEKRTAPAPDISQDQNAVRVLAGDGVSDKRQKRRRVEDGSYQNVASASPHLLKPLLDGWLQVIDTRLSHHSGLESLPPLDRSRYKLLRDACLRADVFYIILHQVFCLWSFSRQGAHSLLEAHSRVVDSTFELLLYALRNNSELSTPHLMWLSLFPFNLHDAAGATLVLSTYSRFFAEINAFLSHFPTGWEQLLVGIDSRRYPLMIWEIKEILKCESTVLQEVLFTSSRRRLADDASAPASEFHRIFALDRQNESQISDVSERNALRSGLSQQYRVLIQQARADASQPQLSPLSTTAPDFVPSLGRSSLDGEGASTVSQSDRLAHQTHSPSIQQHQALGDSPVHVSSYNPKDDHEDGSNRPTGLTVQSRFVLRSNADDTDAPRPTASPASVISSPHTLAQQFTNCQPSAPHTTQVRQTTTSTPALEQPNYAVRIAPQQVQAWQPTQQPAQYVSNPASLYLSSNQSPSGWVVSRGFQQQGIPMTSRSLPYQQQRGPTAQYPSGVQQSIPPAQHRLSLGQQSNAATPYPLGIQQQSSHTAQYPSGIQQRSNSVTPYAHGWNSAHPQQTVLVAGQHMRPWSNNAFPPGHSAAAHQPSPITLSSQRHQAPVSAMMPARPEQLRPPAAASPTESQHEVVRLPETEYPPNEHDWTSLRHGLHLVRLRSPRRVPCLSSGWQMRYYQFVSHFAVEPTPLVAGLELGIFEFSVSQEDLSKVVLIAQTSTVPVAPYTSRSLRYRLRVCRSATPRMTLSEWSSSPSFWPPHVFLTFNGQGMHPRRRQHFHRDLPMELSDLLKLGTNTAKISLPAVAANLYKTANWFMAVEVVTTLDYPAVRSLIDATQHRSTDDTRAEIARRLRLIDSDEVTVEDDVLCVSVTDPFSSVLFTIPVRGAHCKHIECFDLEIWLDTRRGKPSHDRGEPSLIDDWKCPICGLDARPVSLQIDDYFSAVRQKLVEDGCCDTRTIRIKADGSWTAVQESDDVGNDDEDKRRSGPQATEPLRTERAQNRDAAAVPIIILDDD